MSQIEESGRGEAVGSGSSSPETASTSLDALARIRWFKQELNRLMQLHFASSHSLKDFLKEATETGCRVLNIRRASVWVFENNQESIRCVDLFDALESRHLDGQELSASEYPEYFKAIAESRVVDASDALTDPRTKEFEKSYLKPQNIVSMLDAQIPSSIGAHGILCCEAVVEPRQWHPDEASFAVALAQLIGLAFERADRHGILSAIEQRNAQIQEQSTELSRLALVAQHTEDAVIICSKNQSIEWANTAFIEFAGVPLKKIRGRAPTRFLQNKDTDRDTVQKISSALEDKKPALIQIRNQPNSGSAKWYELQINPIFDESGDVERYFFVQRDITDRKAHEEKLAAALRQAEDANAAKSTFLATMSHEIRTPMNGVLGMITALEATEMTEDQSRMLGVVREAGDMLLRILNDVLDFSRIEAGEVTIEQAPFLVSDILMKIESLHGLKARERGIELNVQKWEGADQQRLGDPTRILQVLHNLVGNAIKFTDQGHVTVSCTIFDENSDHSEILFEVKDTGIGMSPEQLSRVFDRFQQADDTTTRRYGGTGLGLSIAKGLSDAMGGRISVESAIDEGSTFRVWLPIKLAKAEQVKKVDSKSDAQEAVAPYENLSVLAAEDNAINRMVLQTFLEPLGFKIEFAENGKDAVDKFTQGEFDIILMDIQMPVMGGEDALAEIRRLEEFSGRQPVPVIAVTACALEHEVAEYEEAGFSGYVAKPVDVDKLCLAISNCLKGPLEKSA